MSKQSTVGTSTAYEAGDQRNYKDSELQEDAAAQRFHEGQPGSHKQNDPKDERSIANKLARESKRENESGVEDPEAMKSKKDSTLPATSHGNAPSKGAKVDQELQEEEEEMMKKKGEFGSKQQ